jgi:hypothetical protein
MDKPPPSDSNESNMPAYSCVQAPEITDEDRLRLYAIYRNESRGHTYEPMESMFQAAKAAREQEERDAKRSAA